MSSEKNQSVKIISISGLDGSGKTTQVTILKDYLEQKGEKVLYFHAIQFSIATKINNLFKNNKSEKTSKDKDSGNSVSQASWFSIQLRKIFLIIDILRFKKLVKKIKNQSYTYLVTDRYFYDSIINIEYLTQKLYHKKDNVLLDSDSTKNYQTCLVIKIIEKIIPHPNKAFFLSVSPEKIITRDRAPEQGLNYLKIKNSILNRRFKKWNLQKVSGEGSKEETFSLIKNNLN